MTTATMIAGRPEDEGTHRTGTVRRSWALTRLVPILVAAIGLLITGVLTAPARIDSRDTQQRLLGFQARLTASTLGVGPVDLERRLGTAATEASLTEGTAGLFRKVIATSVGGTGPLVDAELLRRAPSGPSVVGSVGGARMAATTGTVMAAITRAAVGTHTLAVEHLSAPGRQRLGYAMAATSPSGGATFAVYGEQAFPADRRVRLPLTSPDADFDFALYYGRRATARSLLESDTTRLPLSGTTSRADVPFGDVVLTLVVSPRGSLAGSFAPVVPWIVLALGLVCTAGVVLLAAWLAQRQRSAEVTASENRRLYRSERQVSETLQRALLPAHLPQLEGVELAARYCSGGDGVEVGGDWYDVVEVGDRFLFFCVGDVSGRGVEAAVLMAQLRHAINAHAADGREPSVVLSKVGRLVDIGSDGHFATAVCGRLDLASGELTVANAGHLVPVVVDGEGADLLATAVGPPLGVGGAYAGTGRRLSPGATVLAFTDGLVERRGEPIDAGLERLRSVACSQAPLEQLVDHVLATMVPGGPHDDIALLGLRWRAGTAHHPPAVAGQTPAGVSRGTKAGSRPPPPRPAPVGRRGPARLGEPGARRVHGPRRRPAPAVLVDELAERAAADGPVVAGRLAQGDGGVDGDVVGEPEHRRQLPSRDQLELGEHPAQTDGPGGEEEVLARRVDGAALERGGLAVAHQARQHDHRCLGQVDGVVVHRRRHPGLGGAGDGARTCRVPLGRSLARPDPVSGVTQDATRLDRPWAVAQHDEPERLAVRARRRPGGRPQDGRQLLVGDRTVRVAPDGPGGGQAFEQVHGCSVVAVPGGRPAAAWGPAIRTATAPLERDRGRGTG